MVELCVRAQCTRSVSGSSFCLPGRALPSPSRHHGTKETQTKTQHASPWRQHAEHETYPQTHEETGWSIHEKTELKETGWSIDEKTELVHE